jgi:hypothetical protein
MDCLQHLSSDQAPSRCSFVSMANHELSGCDGELIGHGFRLGRRGLEGQRVRRARKAYSCAGCLCDGATFPASSLTPASGAAIRVSTHDKCAETIQVGDLHAVLELDGEFAASFGASYRYTLRSCLVCSLHFEVVVR